MESKCYSIVLTGFRLECLLSHHGTSALKKGNMLTVQLTPKQVELLIKYVDLLPQVLPLKGTMEQVKGFLAILEDIRQRLASASEQPQEKKKKAEGK
jgi:hypothetical protein